MNGIWLNETPGPYARATGVNGHRGYIVDLSTTNPKDWDKDTKPVLKSFNDIIIYEIHLQRQMSCIVSWNQSMIVYSCGRTAQRK